MDETSHFKYNKQIDQGKY